MRPIIRKIRFFGARGDDLNYEEIESAIKSITGADYLDTGWVIGFDSVRMTCLKQYVFIKRPKIHAEIAHYTIGNCCREKEVYCVKRKKGSQYYSVTKHLVGECPHLNRRDYD